MSSLARGVKREKNLLARGPKESLLARRGQEKVVIEEGSQNEKRIGYLGPEARSG